MKICLMRKRLSIILLFTFFLMLLTAAPLMADNGADTIKLFLNGQQLYSDVDPVIVDGRTLVPLRVISEGIGAEVSWDESTRTVTVIGGTQDDEELKMKIQIGSKDVELKQGDLTWYQILDTAAEIRNDRTMVPIRFVCENLGMNVLWDGEERTVYLLYSSCDAVPAEITTNEVRYQNDWIDVYLKIPVLSGLTNAAVQDQLNTILENEAMQFKGWIEEDAEEYYQQAADNEELHFWSYAAYSSFMTAYNKNNLLSITVDYYDYTGGAHGYTEKTAYNYDLISGKEIGLSDLFISGFDFKSVIDQEIKKQMQQNPEIYFEDDIGAFQGIDEDQPFYIEEDGIVIYFGLYEIAPYAAGIREFKVPFTMLQEARGSTGTVLLLPEFNLIRYIKD